MSFASLRRVLRSARKGLCATCSKTRYPQLEAAGAGHVGCLIYTLETVATLIKDDHEVTALHIAARKGQISILIYLVENEVVKHNDVFKAKNGATPAHDAAGTGNLECLRYLLSRTRAGPNDLDNNAATPLHWAAQNGHLMVVQWLVSDAQAPIDAVAKNGITPFHLAAAKNHLDVLRWLVGYAFRHYQQPMKLVNAKDRNGSTPLYHSAHAGHMQVVHWLASKGGGDPTITNRQGLAPLHAATISGHLKIVQYLFQFGLATAPGGLQTTEGASSLHFAAAENHIEIMQWLLEQIECTGSERDHYQSTPLHDAAENGHLDALKLLCEHEVDPTLEDVEGNTPYDLAIKNGSTKCAVYLKNYMNTLLKRQINGNISKTVPPAYSKIQHNRHQTQGQFMERYTQPPHVNSFEDEEDIYSSSGTNAEEWATLHDLMNEDEIHKLSQKQDTRQYNLLTEKRKLFEERLAREQEERQRKHKTLASKEKETKEETRSQFMKSHLPNVENLKSLEDTDGVREFVSQLENKEKNVDQKAKASKKKSLSLPRYSLKNESAEQPQRTKDDLDTESTQNKKWFSKFLSKRSTSSSSSSNTTTNRGMTQSKSLDFSIKTRRTNADSKAYWNIPQPPSPPSVEYLIGKSRVAHLRTKPTLSLKEELQQTVWGRDAYDDKEEEEDSDSDHIIRKPINKFTKQKKIIVKELPGKDSDPITVITPKQKRHHKPFPSIDDVSVPKSDLPVPRLHQQQQQQQVVTKPVVEPNYKPLSPPTNKVMPAKAPIMKAASARVLIRQDTPTPSTFASRLNAALGSSLGEKPKALGNVNLSPPQSPKINNSYPGSVLSKQITPPQNLHPVRPPLRRQTSIDDDDDDSFTSSSEEESGSSDEDDDFDKDRPIMARNLGIHGARIAKEIMLRMKNQRYPSIFRKPIVTLDTLVEVRHEQIYQANNKEEMAQMFDKSNTKRKYLVSWVSHVRQLKHARQTAVAISERRKREILANVFYSWIQLRNEAEVELQEKISNARKFYKQKMKDKIFQKWKTITKTGVKHEELEEKYLKWLNAELAAVGRPQVNDLFKSLADGVLIIIALANASGKKPPRYKAAPKIKIHKQDNWKVAYDFMQKIGINTKDFEPADLADLHEHAIYNMFHNIFRWKTNL